MLVQNRVYEFECEFVYRNTTYEVYAHTHSHTHARTHTPKKNTHPQIHTIRFFSTTFFRLYNSRAHHSAAVFDYTITHNRFYESNGKQRRK